MTYDLMCHAGDITHSRVAEELSVVVGQIMVFGCYCLMKRCCGACAMWTTGGTSCRTAGKWHLVIGSSSFYQ